jgi:uncharacterized protein (TIGR03435 family)
MKDQVRPMPGHVHSAHQTGAIASILLAACTAFAVSARGQTTSQAVNSVAPSPPAFEVVSVKENKSNCNSNSVNTGLGLFTARCNTLLNLLFNAFPEVKPSVSIPGLPGWATSAHFDVDAKADDATIAALQKLSGQERWKQTELMLQTALADRFKLRTHIDSREGPIYELVIAKGGSRLKNATAGEQPRGYSWGRNSIQVRTGPIASFVFALSDNLSRTVVDKTGLSGNFDIDLKWTPDDQQGMPDAGPALFTAIEEQLGLKLVPSKGPVDTIVVDHVEKPSEN